MPYGGAPPDSCQVWLSDDVESWGRPALEADLSGLRHRRSLARIPFAGAISGRYLRVHLPRAVDGKPIISIDRIGITTAQA